jgi:hypothetical protein
MKIKYLIFMGILSFILSSCKKPDFDKLVYETYNGSLAPEYRERNVVEVTKGSITYTSFLPNNENFELTEVQMDEAKIDSADFVKLKEQVYQLGVIKCKSSEDCDGGGTHTITGYKNGKTVFSNTHFGCGGDCSSFHDLLQILNEYRSGQ